MKKLLALKTEHFLTGIGDGGFLDTGVFLQAVGINPFVSPTPDSNSQESTNVGLLQTGPAPTNITGEVVTDTIVSGADRVISGVAPIKYMYGNLGSMYALDLSANNPPTSLRSGSTVANPAIGFEIYKSTDGTEYLYYFRTTKIGRWDFDGPTGTFEDDWDTGIANSTKHETHFFKGSVWFTNLNGIGRIYSVTGSGATTSTTSLTFPADFTSTCLEDDGNYLVVGITKNQGDNTVAGDTRVLFWDTVAQNFNQEWVINDFGLNALKRAGDTIYAFCGRGVWAFNHSTRPKRVRTTGNPNSVNVGLPNAADVYNDSVVWGGATGTYLNSYGSFFQRAPSAYFQPFAGLTGSPTYVSTSSRAATFIVATNTPRLFLFDLTTGGATGLSAQTNYIDLDDVYDIEGIRLVFGTPLTGSDSVSVSISTDESATPATFGTAVVSTTESNLCRMLQGNAKVRGQQLKLKLTFNAGNPKIRRIEVYGTRLITQN